MAEDKAEDRPATAAETAAAQAVKADAQKNLTPAEAEAEDLTKGQKAQAEVVQEKLANPPQSNEMHLASDLMAASRTLFGVPPEVVAGAMHHAGIEMTQEVTVESVAANIESYMDQPA
jgi:hypothetical protein